VRQEPSSPSFGPIPEEQRQLEVESKLCADRTWGHIVRTAEGLKSFVRARTQRRALRGSITGAPEIMVN
jgi:hypothetical protein